jgi:CHAT domain
MIFRITAAPAVGGGWQVLIQCPADPAWQTLTRQIGKGDRGYPRPPAGEPDWWPVQPLYSSNEDANLQEVHNRCIRGAPDWAKDDVKSFGRYLFATLLGPDWQHVEASAPAGALELELDLTDAGSLFERLPWEMMFTADEPLAGLTISGRRVAVSRIVRVEPPPPTAEIEIPLRVLFVVGRQMDDAIQPGAEYFGLLRQFEFQVGALGESCGVALHTKLLLNATRDEMSRAIQSFGPSVVHLISHGRRNGVQTELLLIKDDNAEDPVTPEALLPILQANRSVQAVVLNACHTGEPSDMHSSYAPQLVRGGIPVVVGMAGQVADSVCRLFTSSFYAALYEGRSLPSAVCEGRRAALLQYKTYTQNVEWARPILYRADKTDTTFRLNKAKQNVAIAAKALRKRKELLCDRMGYLQDLQRICERRISNLGFAMQEPKEAQGVAPVQMGKTWLLEEMRWLSLLEGYVPCLLESGLQTDPPKSFLMFALSLAEAMNETRKAWNGTRRWRSAALETIYCELDKALPSEDRQLSREFGKVISDMKTRQVITTADETVKSAIIEDLSGFLAEAKRALGVRGILLLIDDLHRYDGVWQTILQTAGPYGLGDMDTPAPLVFSYAAREDTGQQIGTFLVNNSSTFEMRPLTRFAQEERLMVYRQSLLSRKYVLTAMPALQLQVQNMFGRFEKLTQGIPSYLTLTKLMDQLDVSIDDNVLLRSA